ncbi:MAG TPA: hypothetical protein VNE41_07095 [Chitinophagaceae bacterium]|nr:hypothetical protein [Chitinophagaceae bacterium]
MKILGGWKCVFAKFLEIVSEIKIFLWHRSPDALGSSIILISFGSANDLKSSKSNLQNIIGSSATIL